MPVPPISLLRRQDGSQASAGSGSIGAGAGDWRAHATPEDFVLESWSEGFMVGALIIMACITVANMRRKVLLHKLILLEQLLAMSHGTFCFMSFRGYGWYLSATATLLYCSWFIHNLVAWMKVKPFIVDRGSLFSPKAGKWTRYIYMGTLCCTIPPIILQIYDNFRFFNNLGDFYTRVRPYEPLFRDPWWIFTCVVLFHVVQKCYGTGVIELIRRSPRFGILLVAIILSLAFTALDIASSIHDFLGTTDGINPWWKLSLVCKCLTDTIMLDDFKTELKRLGIKRIRKEEDRRQSFALVLEDKDTDENGELEFADALNVSPERLAKDRRKQKRSSSFRGRLRNNSAIVDANNDDGPDRRQRGEARDSVGKGGRRISPLPSLGISKKWRFGRRSKNNSDGTRPWDEERDPPDVQRFEPQQDPLTRARTWETDHRTDCTAGDDTLDGVPNNSTEQIDRPLTTTTAEVGQGRYVNGSAANGRGGRDGVAMAGERQGSRGGGAGSPDFDSIDFQTRPTGF